MDIGSDEETTQPWPGECNSPGVQFTPDENEHLLFGNSEQEDEHVPREKSTRSVSATTSNEMTKPTSNEMMTRRSIPPKHSRESNLSKVHRRLCVQCGCSEECKHKDTLDEPCQIKLGIACVFDDYANCTKQPNMLDDKDHMNLTPEGFQCSSKSSDLTRFEHALTYQAAPDKKRKLDTTTTEDTCVTDDIGIHGMDKIFWHYEQQRDKMEVDRQELQWEIKHHYNVKYDPTHEQHDDKRKTPDTKNMVNEQSNETQTVLSISNGKESQQS